MAPHNPILGPDGYSLNPSTRRVRSRIANLPPDKLEQHKIYTREYGALFQACKRRSHHQDYQDASLEERRQILTATLDKILDSRRRSGIEMAGIDPASVVDNHLRKETGTARTYNRNARPNAIAATRTCLPTPVNGAGSVINGPDDFDYYDEILENIGALQADNLLLSSRVADCQDLIHTLLEQQEAIHHGKSRKRRSRSMNAYSPYPSPSRHQQHLVPTTGVAYQHMDDEEGHHRTYSMSRPVYTARPAIGQPYQEGIDGSIVYQAHRGQYTLDPSLTQDAHQDRIYPAQNHQQAFVRASSTKPSLTQSQMVAHRQLPMDTASAQTPRTMQTRASQAHQQMLPPSSLARQVQPTTQTQTHQSGALSPNLPPAEGTLTTWPGSSLFTGGPPPGIPSYPEPHHQRHQHHQAYQNFHQTQQAPQGFQPSGMAPPQAEQQMKKQENPAASGPA